MDNDTDLNGENIKTFNLRIPTMVHAQFKAACKNDRRSMNQKILVMIEVYLESCGIKKETDAINK